MATNLVKDEARYLNVVCTAPAAPNSGDPVLFGQLPGVALIDEASDGKTVIDTGGVYDLSVEATGGAMSAGAIVYYDAANDPVLNDDSQNGVRFGYLLEAIANGETDTVNVKIGY